jgi:hypothetical protein
MNIVVITCFFTFRGNLTMQHGLFSIGVVVQVSPLLVGVLARLPHVNVFLSSCLFYGYGWFAIGDLNYEHTAYRHGKDVLSHDVSARAAKIGQAEHEHVLADRRDLSPQGLA